MSHQVERMMFVGETPWHGLGRHLDTPPANVLEAIEAAGLNWTVSLHQLQMANGTQVDRFAVLRDNDASVLGTVGRGYRPIQNADAFSFFDPYLESGAATIDTAGSLKGGSRVWMLAKIDRPDSVIVAKADDRVSKFLLLANGHDGSLAVHVGLTPVRVVCQNTLSAAIDGTSATIKIRHTTGAVDALKEVQKTIARVDNDFEKAAEVFRALSTVYVKNATQLRAYIDAVFLTRKKVIDVTATDVPANDTNDFAALLARPTTPRAGLFSAEVGGMTQETKSRVYEEVAGLFEKGRGNDAPGVAGTAWAAYNAVTEYMTWERGGSDDNRMDALWLKGAGPAARALPSAVGAFLSS
jgi:phage/plasmid-like protein (TIGR03299 family)